MKRILITSLIVCLMAVQMGAVPVYAATSSVSVEIAPFSVTFAGQKVGSANDEYPCLLYRNITYVPLTYYGCSAMGLQSEWTRETGLIITPSEKYGTYCMIPATSENEGNLSAKVATMPITLCGTKINNKKEAWPFLSFRDVIYMPATWHNFYDLLGRNYVFSNETGLSVGKDTGEVRDDYEQTSRRKEVYDYLVHLAEEKSVRVYGESCVHSRTVYPFETEREQYEFSCLSYRYGKLKVGRIYWRYNNEAVFCDVTIPLEAQENYEFECVVDTWPWVPEVRDASKGYLYPGNYSDTKELYETYHDDYYFPSKDQAVWTDYYSIALQDLNELILKPAGYDLSDLGFGGF